MRFYYANGRVVLPISALWWEHWLQKCILLAAMLLFHSCFFAHSINQGLPNLFNRRVICRKPKTPASCKTSF